MIKIDGCRLIGKGFHRECYRHPENKNLCIKLVVAGGPEESRREKQYYRHLERRGISWEMIPKYHGDIETDQGIGSVFDLIVDQDGSVSKTLKYYLSSNEKTEANYDGLSTSLYLLKDYLFQQRIITMTLKPKNMVGQKDRSGIFRLFIVDNLGNSDFFPICNYNNYLANKKISRKWRRFEDRILNAHKDNRALQRILTHSYRRGVASDRSQKKA